MQSNVATLVWQYKISALEIDFSIVSYSRNGSYQTEFIGLQRKWTLNTGKGNREYKAMFLRSLGQVFVCNVF